MKAMMLCGGTLLVAVLVVYMLYQVARKNWATKLLVLMISLLVAVVFLPYLGAGQWILLVLLESAAVTMLYLRYVAKKHKKGCIAGCAASIGTPVLVIVGLMYFGLASLDEVVKAPGKANEYLELDKALLSLGELVGDGESPLEIDLPEHKQEQEVELEAEDATRVPVLPLPFGNGAKTPEPPSTLAPTLSSPTATPTPSPTSLSTVSGLIGGNQIKVYCRGTDGQAWAADEDMVWGWYELGEIKFELESASLEYCPPEYELPR